MPYYLVADIQVNEDSWIPEYAEKVHHIVHRHGGKYLSRGPVIETVEGESTGTNVMAIVEFPDLESLHGFVDDPAYQPSKQARIDGTVSRFHVIDNTDAAGTIPYLKKPS